MNPQIKCFRCHLQRAPGACLCPECVHMEDRPLNRPLNAKDILLEKSDSGLGGGQRTGSTNTTTQRKQRNRNLVDLPSAFHALLLRQLLTSLTHISQGDKWWQCGPPAFTWINKNPAGRGRAKDFRDCLESFVVKCLPFVCTDRLPHHTAYQRECRKA